MFMNAEDIVFLKELNRSLHNKKLNDMIKRYENATQNHNFVARNKISKMREKFPYYARSKSVQERHYSKLIKKVKEYIDAEQYGIANGILDRIINENNYSTKQLYYFMETIPDEIMQFYHDYNN